MQTFSNVSLSGFTQLSRKSPIPGGFTMEDILEKIPHDKALTAVYRPIVIQELACYYARQTILSCKALLQSSRRKIFPRQARLLNSLIDEFEHDTYSKVSSSSANVIKSFVDSFLGENANDLTKLWFAFNSEIKRTSPSLSTEQYRIVSDAMMSLAFIEFYFSEAAKVARFFEKSLGVENADISSKLMRLMKKPLCDMTFGCDIDPAKCSVIVTGITIIVNRVMKIRFEYEKD